MHRHIMLYKVIGIFLVRIYIGVKFNGSIKLNHDIDSWQNHELKRSK